MSGLVGSASLIPRVTPSLAEPQPQWGGEAEPTRLHPIKDPVLRAAVTQAYLGWVHRYAPHLLTELETE